MKSRNRRRLNWTLVRIFGAALAMVLSLTGCSATNEVEPQAFDQPGYVYEARSVSFSEGETESVLAHALETPEQRLMAVLLQIPAPDCHPLVLPRFPDLSIHQDRVEIVFPAQKLHFIDLELPEPHEPVNDIAVLSRDLLRKRVALWLSQEDRSERCIMIAVEEVIFDEPLPGTPEAEDFVIRLDADRSNFVLFTFLDPQAERLYQALSGPEQP